MKTTIYLWQDARDHNMISIGVKTLSSNYVSWTSVMIDGVAELFGKDAYDTVRARDFGTKIIALEVAVTIGEITQ